MNYPTFTGAFNAKIDYHSALDNDNRVKVKLSYKSAFLFVDGENVATFYPTPTDNIDFWVREILDLALEHNAIISNNEALEIARYAIGNIKA